MKPTASTYFFLAGVMLGCLFSRLWHEDKLKRLDSAYDRAIDKCLKSAK